MEEGLLSSFCRPQEAGVWANKLPSGFGAYTPCLVDSFIINISSIVLLFFTIQRIRALVYGVSIERFKVSNPWRYCPGLLLASFCAVAPLTQIALGVSTVNLDGESSMPPFEVCTLLSQGDGRPPYPGVEERRILVYPQDLSKKACRWKAEKLHKNACVVRVVRVVGMDTPSKLILKEDSMFAGMVRSTGPANARYLQRIAMGDVDRSAGIEKDAIAQKTKWETTSRWARAAQWALAMSLTNSQSDLTAICEDEGEETILEFTRDATRTLHQVLTGQHDETIREALIRRQGSEERWWSALSRILEGFAVMGRQARIRIPRDQDREPFDWSQVSLTGSPRIWNSHE